MAVSAFAPASIGNVSVGFDILGAALKPIDGQILGDNVEVHDGDSEFSLEVKGWFADKLPSDPKKNIVYDAFVGFKKFMEEHGKSVKPLHMVLFKNLPIGSGLGSSAASIVAAVAALNAFHDNPMSENEALELMGTLEGKISGSVHYDNDAPSYLGGIQLLVNELGVISEKVPSFADWYWVSCYPGIVVSTAAARAILPKEYSRADAITFARRMGVFIQASHNGNGDLAAAVLKDCIAEPYRRQLIPGFDDACAKGKELGAIASGISGSGPSIFIVMKDLKKAEEMQDWLKQNFIQNDNGFCNICRIDTEGTVVTKL